MNGKVNTTWKVSIVRDQRRINGWMKMYIKTDRRRFSAEAKVYDLPDGTGDDYQGYGVREGSRVSKLSIRDLEHYPPLEVYNWDRGLDFDKASKGLVDAIVDYCDALPQIKEEIDYEDGLDQQETLSEIRKEQMR